MSFAVRVYLNEGRDPRHLVFGYEEATAVLRLAAEFDVSVVGSPRHALEVVFAELNVDEPFEPWAVEYRRNRNRSLSVGDVVEVDGERFACAGIGWTELEG